MVNAEAMKEIEQLNKEYEDRWGKKVDYSILPPGITQEKMVPVLKRIVETGESILVGWNKVRHLTDDEVVGGKEVRNFHSGDMVCHFKRESLSPEDKATNKYLYRIVGEAEHTETGEKLMVYQALYGDYGIYARPYEMFMGKVDREKYPSIRQEYRFEKQEAGIDNVPVNG